MSVQEIERAITQLSSKEMHQLADWLIEYRHEQWDKQIEEDARAGRLDDLLNEVKAEIQQGLAKPL